MIQRTIIFTLLLIGIQAQVLQERGTLLELVDPDLGSEYSKEEAMVMLNVSLLCTNASPTLRPTMSKVVSLLEGQAPLQPLLSSLSISANPATSSGVRRNFWQNPTENQATSVDASDIDLSASAPINDGSLQLLRSCP